MKYQLRDWIVSTRKSPRRFERLVLDEHFHILNGSKQVKRFAACPEEATSGKDIRLSFPEFIGLEDVLLSLLTGKQKHFELKGIGRYSTTDCYLYIDIYIFAEFLTKSSEKKLVILIEDVTEKMLLKQRLSQRANEAKLLSSVLASYKSYMDKVLTSMADALLVTSKSGSIKKVNRAAAELFGYQEDELINQSISLIVDDNNLLQKAIQHPSLYEQYFRYVEVVCRTKTQEKLLIAFSCSIIKKKLEEDVIYIGRDITAKERRQQRFHAQYAITQILSEFRSIKQVIPQILQAICENLGWDVGELWTTHQYINATGGKQEIHPVLRCVEIWSNRTINIQQLKAVTWQTTYTLGQELPGHIWATNSPVWVKDVSQEVDFPRLQVASEVGLHTAFGFPIQDNQTILGVMVFFKQEVQPQDIDLLQMMVSVGNQIAYFIKNKRANEQLLESEERYRDLFEHANDLIQSVNLYGRFEYVNRAWKKTLGYSNEEVAQLNLLDIIPAEFHHKCRQLFCRVMSGEKIEQLQTVFLTKDGRKIFVEGNVNCKFSNGKPVATRGIFRDITQRLTDQEALRLQQEQTERLLLNILPGAIANRLKQGQNIIAENFAEVTVLFADIVGFTEIASQVSAIQLVNLLNQIFSVFDRLSEQYGLEKIKTIGDAYMVVGGLPTRQPNHAQAIAHMAVNMQTAISKFNLDNSQNLSIRIGIHTGPVVAGVIGIKKFAYDLWGDTVNIASRMESQGLAGKIQVTEVTYHYLQEQFLLEKRGEIEVKGKGRMTTYWLIGPKPKDRVMELN